MHQEKIIREFDINDYKMKTELTRSKLVTSLLTAIRSYQQICELEAQSHALEQILSASRAILGHTDMGSFAAAVVAQLANILDASGEGLVSGYLDDDMHLRVFGGSEQYREFFGHGIEQLDNGRVIMQVQNCIDTESHQSTAHDITFLLESKNKKAAIYLELEAEPSEAQLKFAEIFLTNVGVGLDNIKLFNELREVAYKDNLTKLPNRANFIEKIESYFNQQQSLVFILVDIAQFSDINNGLGQEVGNLLLLGVAERISIEFPEAQLISRIGADVFGFLMPESQFDEESFIDNLCVPYHVGEHLLTMHFHIGVCRQEDFQPQGIETLKLAYIALNQAKQSSIPLDWYTRI